MQAGICVKPTPDVRRNLEIVQELDEVGVPTVWQINNVLWPDAMSFYAAVAVTTTRVRLGTLSRSGSTARCYPGRRPNRLDITRLRFYTAAISR